jgi:hypothetical protein
VDAFLITLNGNEKDAWDRQNIISNLPNECTLGKANNVFYVGNISFTAQPNNRPKLISKDGNLILESDGGKV